MRNGASNARSTYVFRGVRSRDGFTLVELLVVVFILAVLISILLPALRSTLDHSRAAECLSNIREADAAALSFSFERNDLPPHFPVSESQTDEIGVPLIVIEFQRYTLLTNYFNQTSIWIRALRAPRDPVPRSLTCTGLNPPSDLDPDVFASTTYALSAALLADPRLFDADLVDRFEPRWFSPQGLYKVALPASKSMLAEQSVAHLSVSSGPSGITDVMDTPKKIAPVAYVDGHASLESFEGVPAVEIIPDGRSPRPYSHTLHGVRGVDADGPQAH